MNGWINTQERRAYWHVFTFLLWLTGVTKGGSSRWDVSWQHHSNTVYCSRDGSLLIRVPPMLGPRAASYKLVFQIKQETEHSPLIKWICTWIKLLLGFIRVTAGRRRSTVRNPLSPSAEFQNDSTVCCSDATVGRDVASGPDQLSSVPLTSRYTLIRCVNG